MQKFPVLYLIYSDLKNELKQHPTANALHEIIKIDMYLITKYSYNWAFGLVEFFFLIVIIF